MQRLTQAPASVTLDASDHYHVRAAEGWLELGAVTAAFNELENIQPQARLHPDVLRLRYGIYAKAEKWEYAFTIAEGLARLIPDDAEPFLWRSDSARRMQGGSVLQAFDLLRDVVDDFPHEPAFSFAMACYACELCDVSQARSWLHRAFEIAERNGTKQHWKTRALDEPDLAPLRNKHGL